jgi:hypothetical protein
LTFTINKQKVLESYAWSDVEPVSAADNGGLTGEFSRAGFLYGLYKGKNVQALSSGGLQKTVKRVGIEVKFQFDGLELPPDIGKWVKDP